MRKFFIDCGIREGDGTAAFLGDRETGGGAYYRCLQPRNDAHEFSFIGFESPDFKFAQQTRRRFENVRFQLLEQLVWIYDGTVAFDTDGESYDCRLLEVSRTENKDPWRHPNPAAVIKELPCIDISRFIKENFTPADYLVLKLDIEGAEYDVLERLQQTQLLSWFNELYVEYHWWGKAWIRDQLEAAIVCTPGLFYRNDWP